MKTKILLFLFFFHFVYSNGQSVDPYLLSFTGNSLTNGTYTLEYALGELEIETLSGSSYYCTQGLLQPNYISHNGIETIENIELTVYPNPTTDLIFIKSSTVQKFKTIVFDILGGQVGNYDSNFISILNYPNGVYYLRIFDSKNILIKSQTIVKI